jgi:hypothetical protein
MSYRSLPNSNMVAALTSHANGVDIARYYWFEFRFIAPYWTLWQQGVSRVDDGLHKWMPSASIDAYGNMAIGYCTSNVTSWPSLAANMRLQSDFPLGALRNTTLELRAGSDPSLLVSTQWGPANAMIADPTLGRSWFFSGQHGVSAPDAWGVQTSHLLMGQQLVARNWTAFVSLRVSE